MTSEKIYIVGAFMGNPPQDNYGNADGLHDERIQVYDEAHNVFSDDVSANYGQMLQEIEH